MEHLEIILPTSLLAIAFLLKLVVSQSWKDVPNIIQNICELPVDIIFLALSFAVAFTISSSNNHGTGLSYCFIGVGIAILVVFIRKICVDLFLSKKWIWILLCLMNLLISGAAINKSINLIIDKPSANEVEQTIIDDKKETISNQEKGDN